jgi:hypothetical protein
MGLDATVYCNLKNLPEYLRERVVTVNPESGEIDLRDISDYRIFGSSKLEAWHERIGNTAMVAFLREEIAKAFGHQESLLSKKVVYSGSHAGDYIPSSQIDLLGREIDELEKITSASRSPALANFITQMRNLIAAANREGNGIVF